MLQIHKMNFDIRDNWIKKTGHSFKYMQSSDTSHKSQNQQKNPFTSLCTISWNLITFLLVLFVCAKIVIWDWPKNQFNAFPQCKYMYQYLHASLITLKSLSVIRLGSWYKKKAKWLPNWMRVICYWHRMQCERWCEISKIFKTTFDYISCIFNA